MGGKTHGNGGSLLRLRNVPAVNKGTSGSNGRGHKL